MRCDGCAARIPRGAEKRCGRCEIVFYCNRACQVGAWPTHKRCCKTAAAKKVDWGDAVKDLAAAAGAADAADAALKRVLAIAAGTEAAWAAVEDELSRLVKARDYIGIRAAKDGFMDSACEILDLIEVAKDASFASYAVIMEADSARCHLIFAAARVYTLIGAAWAVSHHYHLALQFHMEAKRIVDLIVIETCVDIPQIDLPEHINFQKVEAVAALARAHQDVNDFDTALELYQWSVKYSSEVSSGVNVPKKRWYEMRMAAIRGLADCHLTRGDFQDARRCYDEVMTRVDAVNDSDIHALGYADALHALERLAHLAMREHCHSVCDMYLRLGQFYASKLSKLDAEYADFVIMVHHAENEWGRRVVGEPSPAPPPEAPPDLEALLNQATRFGSSIDPKLVTRLLYVWMRLFLLRSLNYHVSGQQQRALSSLAFLQEFVVSHARNRCWDCHQIRGDPDVTLLSCACCRVAHFCNRDCQRRASAADGADTRRHAVPHWRLCPLLRARRLSKTRVGRETASREKLRVLELAFLASLSV